MKKLLLMSLVAVNCHAMADSICGPIIADKSVEWVNPNELIARLNRDCMQHRIDCPFGCRKYFIQMIQDLTVKFVQDLYLENLVTYEIMEHEIRSLRTEKNAQVIDPIIERIKKLKEETNS